MITHYDIKTETQKLKDVLSVEGVKYSAIITSHKTRGVCVFMGFIMADISIVCWQIKLISEMLDLIYVLVKA